MSDRRKHGTGKAPTPAPSQENPRGSATPYGASRSTQPWNRPLPSVQDPDDTISSPLLPQPASPQRGAKVAIPRLRRDIDGAPGTVSSASSDSKHRVSHACEPCRHRKTKCSGERPVCKHCQDFKIQCNYADGKRDRTKKEYNMMAARLSECEELLQELSGRLGEADQLLIRRTLEKVGYLVLVFRLSLILESKQDMTPGLEESLSPHSFRRRRTSDEDTQGFDTEYQATGRVGSTESLDCITEDFNRSDASRSTGYMGKNSEIAWMGKLRQQTDAGLDEADGDSLKMNFGSGLDELYNTTPKDVHRQLPLNESTYHCDDIPLSAEENVQAYQLPPRATADVLLACYLECVHPAFPILGKTTFTKQYQAFYDNPNLKTGPKWLAVLNLIFAIGARYSCLARADSRGLLDDHQTYFSRARVLGMDAGTVWVHAELQRIQITGLASFYLMATHQINRAFAMNGITIRQAVTLGLHLRNEDPKLVNSSKEIRYRLWWAIASTERTLGVMTGRPTSFVGTDCSAPLPLPLEEESFMSTAEPYDTPAVRMLRRLSTDESSPGGVGASTPSSVSSKAMPYSPREHSRSKSSSAVEDSRNVSPCNALFFLFRMKLACMDDDIIKQLYRPHVMNQSWATVQSVIVRFQKKLERWHAALPVVFDFTRNHRDQSFPRQRMCLGFAYYSTMMIVNRPCLCNIDEKIPNETKRAREIDQANALHCVLAAKSLVDMLPDEPNPFGMYQVAPWWNVVHHLMQAATILMIEISLGAMHCRDLADELLKAAQKTVAWLQSMSADDMAAARAWKLSSELFRKVAPRIGRKIDDRLLWPLQRAGDMSMQDLLMPDGDYGMSGASGYGQPLSGNMGSAHYPPVTTWEPLMFTSYDNYLSGADPSTTQPPSTWDHYS